MLQLLVHYPMKLLLNDGQSMQPLLTALNRVCQLLAESEITVWASVSAQELVDELRSIISQIRHDDPIPWERIALQFAPTSDIQEIALDNGWDDDYMKACDVIDAFVKNHIPS